MTQPIERDRIYRGRRFQTETIELCVRWYITYRLSYRDLAAMMAERGVVVSHTTIMRWARVDAFLTTALSEVVDDPDVADHPCTVHY